MNALWNAIAAQVASHLLEVEAGAAALLVSGIFAIPERFPATVQEWWTWLRDTLQGAVPMKLVKNVNPTPPGGPAEEK